MRYHRLSLIGTVTLDAIIVELAAIPADITALKMEHYRLRLITAENLAIILANIPSHVKNLDLGYNEFSVYSDADLIKVMEAIPKSITTLWLNTCYLDIDQTVLIVNALRDKNITALELSDNFSFQPLRTPLNKLLISIPTSVLHLTLAGTSLEGYTTAELQDGFKALPSHITDLTIGINAIFLKRTSEELIAIAGVIPLGITIHFNLEHLSPFFAEKINDFRAHQSCAIITEARQALTQDRLMIDDLIKITLSYLPRTTYLPNKSLASDQPLVAVADSKTPIRGMGFFAQQANIKDVLKISFPVKQREIESSMGQLTSKIARDLSADALVKELHTKYAKLDVRLDSLLLGIDENRNEYIMTVKPNVDKGLSANLSDAIAPIETVRARL